MPFCRFRNQPCHAHPRHKNINDLNLKKMKRKENKGGRPTVITEERQAKIIELMSDGVSQKKAVSIVGISERAFIRFKKKNSQFIQRLEESMIKTDRLAYRSIRMGMFRGDWRAGAWWLERTNEKFREKREEERELPNLVQNVFDLKKLCGERE